MVEQSTKANSWLSDFHPGWFGAVMGTAVIGIIASVNPGEISSLKTTMSDISIGASALACLLAIILGIPYLARWVLYPRQSWADMADPTVGPLHGTFPGGLLVLAVAVNASGPKIMPLGSVQATVEVLAAIGVPLALSISLLFAYLLFTLDLPDTRLVNGGWFIPPVVTIVVPVVLTTFFAEVSPSTDKLLLFFGYAFWGVGFLLFLLVIGLLHDRLVTQPLPAAAMAPSLWIVLGPLGVGAAALLDLSRVGTKLLASHAVGLGILSLVTASALWGFGAWSLLVALVLLGRYIKRGGIPYGVGWWAFTFPLGALTLATASLSVGWSLSVVAYVALGLFAGLIVLWILVTFATLASLLKGTALIRLAPGGVPGATGTRVQDSLEDTH